MDLEDLFSNNRGHDRQHGDSHYNAHGRENYHNQSRPEWRIRHESQYRHSSPFSSGSALVQQLLQNKILLILLGLVVLLILVVIVAVLTQLFPLIPQLFGYLESNGLKSVVDQAVPALSKVWLGSGK